MRRAFLPVLAMAVSIAAVSLDVTRAAAHAPLTYTISPRFEAGALAGIEVALSFEADQSGLTTLDLPDASMGRARLWHNLRDFTVEGGELDGEGPTRTIRSEPGKIIIVRYVVGGTIDHDPSGADGYPSEPWIRPSWFFVDGPSAIVTIKGREDAPIAFCWGHWPSAYRLASNLEHWKSGDPRQSVLIGGRDLRIVESGPMRLAIRGQFAFDDAELADDLARLLKVERAFFGDDTSAPYLVAASNFTTGSGQQFSGTGKVGAFAMVATPGMTLDAMRPFLAHEIFHAWNPTRLGKTVGPRGYWLSEGLTDFYARRLLQRARLVTPVGFAAAWNEALRAYAASPAKTMPGAQAADAFWTDPHAEKVPYQRGAMLAALWDWRLRQRGSSLDTVLRAQARIAPRRADATLTDLFVEEMARAGVDVRADLDAHVEKGAVIELPEAVFAPCGRLATVNAPNFQLGFEPVADGQGVITITRLRPDSAAHRAGLRDGMVVVRKASGVNGDPAQPYELVVRSTDGAVSTVRFLPQGQGVLRHQQLVLSPQAATHPEVCDFKQEP